MAQLDRFQYHRRPELRHLPRVTPPICCSDKAVTQRWQRRSMNLTDEQHAICQAARDLEVGSSLKIQAFAGSGKTTTLAAIAESLAQRKFLYLVFNRAGRG
jgi:superfamily II DNA or RNA helicase